MMLKYQQMRSSFDYVLEVCNGAIHGQRIAEAVAHEAIDVGLHILRELKQEQNDGCWVLSRLEFSLRVCATEIAYALSS